MNYSFKKFCLIALVMSLPLQVQNAYGTIDLMAYLFATSMAYLFATSDAEQPVAEKENSLVTTEFFRKSSAFIGAPVATAGAFYGVWKGLDYCCKNLGDARPFVTIGTTAGLAYLFAPFVKEYTHTLIAGNQDELQEAIKILNANEESIRDILRELYHTQQQMFKDFHKASKLFTSKEYEDYKAALEVLQGDVFKKQIFALPDGDPFKFPLSLKDKNVDTVAIKDILQAIKAIKPLKDSTNEHWWDVVSAPIMQVLHTVKSSGRYLYQGMQNYTWNFEEDKKLLATWGGIEVETAAKNILNAVDFLYGQNGIESPVLAKEGFEKFTKAAAVLIAHAEQTVQLLRKYRFEITRIERSVEGTYKLFDVQ